jgi:flagellar biosynthesis protein FlhF
MKLRTFTADDMHHAMHMVRDALGDSAIIISTKQVSKSGGVQVTAASDDMRGEQDEAGNPENAAWFKSLAGRTADAPEPVASQPTDSGNVPELVVNRLLNILRHHGINDSLMEYLQVRLLTLTAQDASYYQHYTDINERWMAALIAASFSFAPLELRNDSFRHILIGTPGAGKTLTTAKIAAACVKAGRPVHVITTDNKRAGGVEQLAAITDILGVELLVANSRQSLKAILSDIPLAETVIMDSAGANPYDFYELKDLAEYAGLIDLDPVLVYPSGSDPMEADEVARAFSFIGVEKMIVTRVDSARRFGSIFNAAHAAGLKFANVTGSEKILGTFDACTPEYLTKLLMDYQPEEV